MNPKDRRRRALVGLVAGLLSLLASAAIADTQQPPPAPHAEKLSEAQSLFDEGKHNEAVKAFKEADKLANGSCVECRLGLARTGSPLPGLRGRTGGQEEREAGG